MADRIHDDAADEHERQRHRILVISRRLLMKWLGASAVVVPCQAEAAFAIFQLSSAAPPSWNAVPVGGGGYQSKLSISPSGVILSGTDAGSGCHLGSTVLGTTNVCLQTGSSLPTSFLPSPYIGGDSYDLV